MILTGDWVRIDVNPNSHGLIEVKPASERS